MELSGANFISLGKRGSPPQDSLCHPQSIGHITSSLYYKRKVHFLSSSKTTRPSLGGSGKFGNLLFMYYLKATLLARGA